MTDGKSTYVYQEFPKWKYHATLPSKIVQNAGEEKALGKGWYNTPAEVAKAMAPSRIATILDEKVKPWWTKWQWIVTGCGAIVALVGSIVKLLR
ncbi:MAG: hypothetical protein ABSE40_10375 [Candidatus Sulfotelmatobacter sp.]|jgi:hypothetical protein